MPFVLINFLMPSMKKTFWLFDPFQELKGSVCSPNLMCLNSFSAILQSFFGTHLSSRGRDALN